MNSQAWVQLALKTLACNQKELALRLNVSPTQISKWKKDEHMSFDMQERFRQMVGIGDRHPSFILWAGSIEDGDKWEKLILYLAESAAESAETGYNTYLLQNETYHLCWHTFYVLREMGVKIPDTFPIELDINYDDDGADSDEYFDTLSNNTYSNLINSIFHALNNVYGFFAAYINDIVFDDALDLFETGFEIETCLMALAACKVDVDPALAPEFQNFKSQTLKDYRELLTLVKNKAFQAGIPLKAELLSMVHDNHEALGHYADREDLGLNENRLHPDFYMNELLCGMRIIHQVLPVIMKKLGIDENEFQLDTSKLHVGR